jgi:drug/metabolite transporter (DMT)-like permease
MGKTGATRKTNLLKLYLILTVLMGFWGYAFVAIKSLLTELKPMELTVLRFFFVLLAIIFYFIFDALKGKKLPAVEAPDLWKLFLLGLIGVVFYHVALNYGEQFTSASVASLIVFTSPVFTAIFSRLFLKEQLSLKRILGILIALLGAALIAFANNNQAAHGTREASLGALIVFISPISWSLYTVYGKKLGGSLKGISPLYYSLYTMLFGSLFLMLFLRISTIEALLHLTLPNLLNLFVLSFFSSFLGYIIWVAALEYLDASQVSAFLYLIPVFSVFFSVLLLGEKIYPIMVAGAFAIFAGIYLTERG